MIQIRHVFCAIIFLVAFFGRANANNAIGNAIGADIKVKISRAEASEAQPNEGIERSFDGLLSTIYHSKWYGTEFPVVLTYYFEDVKQIDYLIYHPRNRGSTNGNFMEFELWILAGDEQKEFVKYGNYDFAGSSLPSKIDFVEGIVSPHAIRFAVKSGSGDFVSCAEMSFFQKNTQTIIPPIFSDKTCSELLPDVDLRTIKAIENRFYRRLALSLFNGNHANYRVQYVNPSQDLQGLHIASLFVRKGDVVVVFTENIGDGDLYLFIAESTGKNLFLRTFLGTGSTYILNVGVNSIVAQHHGLLTIRYRNGDSEATSAKIHFATGERNKTYDKFVEVQAMRAEFDAEVIDWSKTLTPKQMKEDIDFFFDFVSKAHVNKYAFVSKDSIKTRKRALYEKCAEPMTVKEFHLQITQLNGMFDEHTGIPFDFSQYVSAKYVFPREIKVTGNQLFIENNDSYDRVLFINDLCVEDLFSVLTNIFHQPSRNPRSQDLTLSFVFPVLLYHFTDARTPFTLRVETAEGEEIEYVVEGTPSEDIDANQTIFPDRLRDFRFYPDESVAIIEYNSSTDSDNLSEWIDEVFSIISDEDIQHLFIDISRNDGGGSIANNVIYNKIGHDGFALSANIELRLSRHFIDAELCSGVYPFFQRLAYRLIYGWKIKSNNYESFYPTTGYAENIYLIQGPQTYSAAVDMAAWFKYSGIGTIIGEETGGPSASFSSSIRNRLPNSKIRIKSASNYIEYPGGKPDRGIMPDIPIELDYSKKYFELEDLKRFLEIIKAESR